MILKGSQRAGGSQLAAHLMNAADNEHVTVHELRGFVSDNLHGAFKEAYAISRGTKCKQFLFSLSLSPPDTESVPLEIFEKAIADIEDKIGLVDQPRAIVFHEKEGRRHAHCVWSRIDIDEMKAINLSHFKLKLRDISKQLYLENKWRMPMGLMDSEERDPLNFTLAEWQQAKRLKINPRTIKQTFRDCWAVSDSKASFESALKERGYYLAQGNRRGFVAVDWRGEIYAVAKYVGIKATEVKAKLGDPLQLPTIEVRKQEIGKLLSDQFNRFTDETSAEYCRILEGMQRKQKALVVQQRLEREQLAQKQQKRWIAETKERSEKLPRGLKALWFRVTGQYNVILKQKEAETRQAVQRDRQQTQALVDRHLRSRQQLQNEVKSVRIHENRELTKLHREFRSSRKKGLIQEDEVQEPLSPRPHLRI